MTKKFQIERLLSVLFLLIIDKNSKVFFLFWCLRNHETFAKSDKDGRNKYKIECF